MYSRCHTSQYSDSFCTVHTHTICLLNSTPRHVPALPLGLGTGGKQQHHHDTNSQHQTMMRATPQGKGIQECQVCFVIRSMRRGWLWVALGPWKQAPNNSVHPIFSLNQWYVQKISWSMCSLNILQTKTTITSNKCYYPAFSSFELPSEWQKFKKFYNSAFFESKVQVY